MHTHLKCRHYIKGTGTYCRVLYFFINLPHSGTLWSSTNWDIFTVTPTPCPPQGILTKVFRHVLLSQSKGLLLVLGEKRPGVLRGILDICYRLQDKELPRPNIDAKVGEYLFCI